MNITLDELYEALRASYQRLKDAPEDFGTVEETLEDVEQSAMGMVRDIVSIVLVNRINQQ